MGTEDYRGVQGEKKMKMLRNTSMNKNRNMHPGEKVTLNKQMLLPNVNRTDQSSWMHEDVWCFYGLSCVGCDDFLL